MKDKIEPVLEAIQTAGSLKKALLWFSAIILAVTGTGMGLKVIIGWFK